ncbi:MAG: hypothetical protein P1U87_15585 [Verrucomicrobiales bacterium]|nr:hypothetical protein [Verrucomicrobiales bacterium]
MNSKFPSTLVALLAFLCLTGCNKDLEERIDRLEAELREVRSDTRENVEGLKSRVIAAENTVGTADDDRSFAERLQAVEGAVRQGGAGGVGNQMVYLRPNLQGHAPLQTDHGTFLIRMEGMELNIENNSYSVHLNIGNPQAIAIEQFTLTGDHGGGTPELDEGEAYSLDNPKIREWQATLKPFEYQVTKTLEPFSWTPFDIELAADSRDELEMIRFSMSIENARLKRQGTSGGTESPFAHIKVDSKGASVLRTEYGAFLVTVKKSEKTDLGTRLILEIGNPYGFTINQCRIIGDHGPALPERNDSASPQEYSEKMREWSANLQPFESAVPDKIANFRWNRTSILIASPEKNVKFLRCQLRVEDVTLPAATDKK